MKITTKQVTATAILLAICVLSQFLKNLSVYITGPVINACLIVAVLTVGSVCAVILSVITPVTAFFITGSPVISAVPLLLPCIMLGNISLCLCIWALKGKKQEGLRLIFSMTVGSLVKGAVMGLIISLLVLPAMLPEAMLPRLTVLQLQFSVTQLITALMGSVLAYLIWITLKKSLS